MDYRVYRLTYRQMAETAGAAVGAALIVSWLFYDNLWMAVFTPLLFLLLRKFRIKKELAMRQDLLLQQFLDLIRSLSASLLAGYSMENAIREAEGELRLLHGGNSYICQEIKNINQGLTVNISLEKLFSGMAERTDCEEIREFAEVFAIAKKSSGAIGEILETTSERIQGRYTTKKEIEVATASRKMEQKVMNVIPLCILLYLKLTDPEYMKVLYGNVPGTLFMTGCLTAYIGALYLAHKMVDIRI